MALTQSVFIPLVVFTSLCCCIHTVESSRLDRYEPNRNGSQPHIHNEAGITVSNKQKTERNKRSYYPWTSSLVQTPQFDSLSVWKPPVYQLSRPYYIPIFGAPGRVPIFYPPQPVMLNPGAPIHNPNKFPGGNYLPPTSTSGPTYLPPPTKTTTEPTKMTIGNRNIMGEDEAPIMPMEEDEAPIWGVEPGNGARPLSSDNQVPDNQVRPTRLPKPARTTTVPPLFHIVNGNGMNSLSASDPEASPPRKETGSGSFVPPPSNNNNNIPQEQQRPPQQTQPQSGPGPCVWAIISCCSATSNQIRYNCFEQRGCHGAFWDVSPCDGDFAKAAIASALNYYNSK